MMAALIVVSNAGLAHYGERYMGVGTLHWSVYQGSGRVAHFGSVIVLLLPESSEQRAFAESLLGAVETAAASYPGTATGLFRELSGLVIDARADHVAPFGVVADDGDRFAVLLCGAVKLDVTASGGRPETLSGADATTYLDRRIPEPIERLALVAAGRSTSSPDQGSDLRLGIVIGTGLAAVPRAAPRGLDLIRIPADAATTGSVPAQTTGPVPGAETDLLPAGSAAPAPASAPAPPPMGEAGRLDKPETFLAAPLSAPPAVEPTPARRRAAPGPKNVVLSVNGAAAVELTRDAIIGRLPRTAEDVASGMADPIEVNDPSVSRVHARITINSEGVWLSDLGTVNGTRILPQAQREWAAIPPHTMTALPPGTRILFGGREAFCDYTPRGSDVPPESLIVISRASGAETGPAGGVADYAFIRSLGQGYQGEFFLAVPPARLDLDAEFVVVKVLAGVTSDDAFRRAVRELRAYAAVESPYLLTVYDAGNDAGRFYYSMQYLPRGSLASRAGSIAKEDVLRAVAQAARAAHALHEAGILHLGISPGRILLGDEHAFLSDMGATQSLVREQTLTGLLPIQDVEFLEPQILIGQRGTRATDIWSLGATLYRMLTGTSIYGDFPDDPLLAIRTAITTKPTLPAELEAPIMELVRSCVREDVAQRSATAAEVADRIDLILAS